MQGRRLTDSAARVSINDPKPLLVWCGVGRKVGGSASHDSDSFHGILASFSSIRFSSPVHFARWLFRPRANAIEQSVILVARWREAKPCMAAITAALTGDTTKLREDARRSSRGGSWTTPRIAKMVIVTDTPLEAQRACHFAEGGQLVPSLEVCVARSAEELHHRALRSDQAPPHRSSVLLALAAKLRDLAGKASLFGSGNLDSAGRDF